MDKSYIGKKVLVTTSDWFYAPNGECYRAVFGTLVGIKSTKDAIGLDPSRQHANWVAVIGNMTIAGCRISYSVQMDTVNLGNANTFDVINGELKVTSRPSVIYDAGDAPIIEGKEIPEKEWYQARPDWCTLSKSLRCDNDSFCFGNVCQHDNRNSPKNITHTIDNLLAKQADIIANMDTKSIPHADDKAKGNPVYCALSGDCNDTGFCFNHECPFDTRKSKKGL